MPAPAVLAAWWDALQTTALVGTARRPQPPELPLPVAARPEADPPTVVLDHLALAAAWRGAGVVTSTAPRVSPAAPDTAPLAPSRALHLLELALTQPPGGAAMRVTAVGRWVDECRLTGHRVPSHLVPGLLDLAAAESALRQPILGVVGERGRWLAQASPTWSETLGATAATWDGSDTAAGQAPGGDGVAPGVTLPEDWIHAPLSDQLEALRLLRIDDPDQARQALAEVFASAPARDRVRYLEVLTPPLPADDDVLDKALDDRSTQVRTAAAQLLDGLVTSDRAQRMAARLRPLVNETRSLLRRSLTVSLPGEPDAGGIRDGLGQGAQGQSTRARDLTAIIAGTPLSTWDDLTSLSPAKVIAALGEEQDALLGLGKAAAAQRNATWAAALLDTGRFAPGLVTALPLDGLIAYLGRLPRGDANHAQAVVINLPGPWFSAVSLRVVAVLRSLPPATAYVVLPRVLDRFHPDSVPALEAWLDSLTSKDQALRRTVAGLISALSFTTSITEAFR